VCLLNFLPHFLSFLLRFFRMLFSYLFTSLLVYFLTFRIDVFRFRFCYDNFLLWYILLWMRVCFCCVCFRFSVLSQEIGWEERLRNDLFCVTWDVKPKHNQSILVIPSVVSICLHRCAVFGQISYSTCPNQSLSLLSTLKALQICTI